MLNGGSMRHHYPEIHPYQVHALPVGDGHTLYVEESGNPKGVPIVFIHGGPGAGCSPQDRGFFDPTQYRIILFDQRGCGNSKPYASLDHNTPVNLVADLEKIRTALHIDRWVLFGGSWGSTLSLLYAITHPDRVQAMILRGIFLCRARDIQWFYQYGASEVFSDYWQDFLAPIPENEQTDLLGAYYRRLTGENELVQMTAAKAWSLWEGRCATLVQNPALVERFSTPHTVMSLARIEAHFFQHQLFLPENYILNNAHRFAHIPGIIVHGRYDMVCPAENATTLQHAWPTAQLWIMSEAGHSALEPSITDALIRATDAYVDGSLFPQSKG